MSVQHPVSGRLRQTLYTPAERARRDSTVWTLVQGVLAPLQFLAFALSLCLVVNFLVNGSGLVAATLSVMIKTAILYAIMVTGAIWEKAGFGRYLFANLATKYRCFFAVKIALKTVANRLVQHNARPSGAKHNFHFASRCRHRVKVQHGNA